MADDDWITPDAPKAAAADDWVDVPHDHPVEEKPTFASRAAEPITSYPAEYKRQREGSLEMAKSGVEGLWKGQGDEPNPVKAFGKDALNLGKTLAGAIGYVGSPISAGLTTAVGKPVEQATGSPFAGKMAETAAGLAIPGYGLTRVPFKAIPSVPGATAPVIDAVKEAREALAKQNLTKAQQFKDAQGRPMELSYGEAAQDRDAFHLEDMAEQGAYGKPAQDVATPIQRERFDVMHGAGDEIGQELGGQRPDVTNPEHAARVINDEMRQHAERIAQTRQSLEHYANSQEQAQTGMLADQERALGDIVRGGGEEAGGARETGELVGQSVRSRAASARTGVNQAYENAFALPGEIHAGAFEGVGTRIKGDLTFHNDPVIIDDVTTPVASRAIQHLDKSIDQLRIQNRADPMGQPNPENITAVNLRGVDQLRKQLNRFYAAARSGQNPSDARAMGRIIDAFDNQVESAVAGNLFSGDPRALQALRDARAAYRNYTQTFRPQGAGDDVGQAMRRIIDRGATPEEVSRLITGSGVLGNGGTPVRLAQRLEQVFGRESQEWSAIRQTMWQQASTGAPNAQKTAQRIEQFANSTLGRQMFRPEELAAMRNHAQAVRTLEQTISTLPARQQAERFAQGYERFFSGREIGGSPGQTLRKIAEGRAQPEEIVNTVFKAIGSGRSGEASRMVDAIGAIAGRESPAFDALRQGAWQTITKKAPGMDKLGPQKLSQDIMQFVGSPVAKKLYSPDELKRMREYAEVVKLKTPQPKSKVNPAGTAPSLAIMARRVLTTHALPSIVNETIGKIPIPGSGLAAHGINSYLAKFTSTAEEAAQAAKVKRSLSGMAPDQPKAANPRGPLRFTVSPRAPGSAVNAFPDDQQQRASGGRAMADGGDPSDADMSQDAAEAAASRVRAPYARAEARESGLPSLLEHYGSKVKDALTAPQDALEGRLQVNDPETNMPTPEAIERAGEVAGLAMGSGFGATAARGAEPGALGIVPVPVAKRLNVQQAPVNDLLRKAVEGTPGARIDEDGHLVMNVVRHQSPMQEGEESVRHGVFYLPQGNKNMRHYNGTTNNSYGGNQRIEGETAFKNPLLVKGATGGKAPQMAVDQLLGKGSYKAIDKDAWSAAFSPKDVRQELIERFLQKHSPGMTGLGQYILDNSTKGNTLMYALKEAAVAHAAREAGHDGVIGYSVKRDGSPFLSEVFDVRESHYPDTGGGYGLNREFETERASGGRVSLSTRRESNYSPTRGVRDHHCGPDRVWPKGFCAKFRGPHSCAEVGGFIAARGGCDWYERAPEGHFTGGRVLGHYVDLNPTEAQKAAGNYRKAHITIHGLGIAIENPKGSERSGTGKDGKVWSVRAPAHYGYVKGFIGRDKDNVDVYVGPNTKSKRAWVIDQHDEKTGNFDEHKVFLGFAGEGHVRSTYDAAFSDGKAKDRLGRIREMSVDDLKKWLHTLRYERAA